jgi:FKBP-type peptidyl-prolyl cis-trans isomerase
VASKAFATFTALKRFDMKYLFVCAGFLCSVYMAAQTGNESSAPPLSTEEDSLSYFLGLSLGYELQTLPFEANQDLLLEGFTSAFTNRAPIGPDSARVLFQGIQMALQEKEQARASQEAQIAEAEGRAFLTKNGMREEVTTTESGLQYEILVQGEGAYPADTSQVEVHYEGSLTDGTVFDSSYERGEPVSFPLNRVIAGWTEGVQLMPVGSTYRFYIPYDLGYGPQGTGPIPPYAVLVFKIELLGIK